MTWNSKQVVEAIGLVAVVVSLLLVAYEVRQANRIAIVNTEFELRNSFQETNLALLTNPDMAQFLVRTNTSGELLDGPDGVRARAWVYSNLNSWLAIALAYENGVTTEETYGNILDNIENAIARASPEMRNVWRAAIDSFPSLEQSPVMQRAREALARRETPDAE